jgi:ABC-type multidrug transport system ATPase subunit
VDGGIFGLLGANGAGKSTLFKAMLDLVPLDEGKIRIAGLDAREEGVEARRRVGYLPEELRLYDRLTGWELLDFVGGLRGNDDRAEWRDWLELFGLWPHRDHLIAEYSLGMRKKIALSAALLGSPPLLLLDEPLNGLDTESMRRLRLRLEALADAGTTVVVSSHVMAFVERVCDRMVILRRGRIAAEGSADELRRLTGMEGAPFEDVFLELALGSDEGEKGP